ncbi:hypothetical protein DRJ58_04705 [Candidatus Acetothermia bacterium]|nr:MAG: hypothetical protein DRJ58_04705 [Candidatus Acetothermia bacterium]
MGKRLLVLAFLAVSLGTFASEAVLLFAIGVHVEPLGVTAQGFYGSPMRGRDYRDLELFQEHVRYLYGLAEVVERHGGVLVVQVQSPFTSVAVQQGNPVLSDLEARGHEIALHFHEEAHLGRNPEQLTPEEWCRAMTEEIGLIHKAGVKGRIRYWSGGNLYTGVLEAAVCAGLDVYGDWKHPRRQEMDPHVIGVNPWRPASGPDPDDMSRFAAHDPRRARGVPPRRDDRSRCPAKETPPRAPAGPGCVVRGARGIPPPVPGRGSARSGERVSHHRAPR